MRRIRRSACVWGLMLLGTTVAPARAAGAGATGEGMTVEEVTPGSATARAGLRAGDVLQRWERGASAANPRPARGDFQTPFDLAEVEIEEAPRGRVTFTVLRAGQEVELTLPPGAWGVRCRPPLPDALRTL